MKTAIFLGAGASAAEGASLQNELFREYFKLVKDQFDPNPIHSMYSGPPPIKMVHFLS